MAGALKAWGEGIAKKASSLASMTFKLRLLGVTKVPILFFLSPTVESLDEKRVVVRIALGYRSKNHLNSMYFGALCAGADCAGGLLAWKLIEESGVNVALVFSKFQAEFHKRADGDVDFVCESGEEIKALVEKAIATGERVEMPVPIKAFVPTSKKTPEEPVASFVLNLSLKRR